MIRSALPIILILASVGLFYTFIDPTYQDTKVLLEQEAKFDEALDKSRELLSIRDTLLAKRNAFTEFDLERLNKLLPDHVDNVRLAFDLDGIASKYNMRVKNIQISEQAGRQGGGVGPDSNPFDSVALSFSVAASYEDLLSFLRDLEKSLRIVDVSVLSFSSPSGDLYEYQVDLTTYWLR